MIIYVSIYNSYCKFQWNLFSYIGKWCKPVPMEYCNKLGVTAFVLFTIQLILYLSLEIELDPVMFKKKRFILFIASKPFGTFSADL